jgi:hypothetical protein
MEICFYSVIIGFLTVIQSIPVYMLVQDGLIIIGVCITVSFSMFFVEAVFLYFEN